MRTLEQKAELVSEFLTQVKAQFPTAEIKRNWKSILLI